MTRNFYQERLRWVKHHHFAADKLNPEKENRFACLKKRDKDEDGNYLVGKDNLLPVSQTPLSGSGKSQKSPLDEITNRVRTVLEDSELLEKIEKASRKSKLDDFLVENKWEIISTIARGKRRISTAQRIGEWIDDIKNGEGNKAEAVRREIGELCMKKDKKPEEDRTLVAAIREEKESNSENKKSRWNKFLERIYEINNPLYTRLADFVSNPVAIDTIPLSGSDAFEALSNPSKSGINRMDLMEGITSENVLNSLSNVSKSDVDNKLKALNDLSAFINHALFLFDGNELSQVIARLSFVEGRIVTVRQEKNRLSSLEETTDKNDISYYSEKEEEIKGFMKNEKESKDQTLRGEGKKEGGLLLRLKKASAEHESNVVFRILQSAIETGGWIDHLPATDREKYLCAIFTLQEVFKIYSEKSASKSAADIFSFTRNVFFQAITSKRKSASKVLMDPASECKNLQKDIEKEISSGLSPAFSDVQSLRMFRSIAGVSGIKVNVSDEKLRIYEAASTATTEELENETVLRSERLRRSMDISEEGSMDLDMLFEGLIEINKEENMYRNALWESDTPKGKYLRNECTFNQLNIVAEREGKAQAKDGIPEFTNVTQWLNNKHYKDLSLEALVTLLEIKHADVRPKEHELTDQREYAANQEIKKENWMNLESPVGHDSADHRYLDGLDKIREDASFSEEERLNLIGELNRNYEIENRDRKAIHVTDISERRDLIANAIQAHIRLRARKLNQKFSDNWRGVLKTKLKEFENSFWESLKPWAGKQMGDMEHASLKHEGDLNVVVANYLKELEHLEKEVEDPMLEVEEDTERVEQTHSNSSELLECESAKHASKSMIDILEKCSEEDYYPEPETSKKIEGMTKFKRAVEDIDSRVEEHEENYGFGEKTGSYDWAWAVYMREEGKIVLNKAKIEWYAKEEGVSYEEAKDIVLTEEKEHAINHNYALHVNSRFFIDTYEKVENTDAGLMLERVGKKWVSDVGLTDGQWKTEVADELIAKRVLYNKYKHLIPDHDHIPKHIPLYLDDVLLFNKLDSLGIETSHEKSEELEDNYKLEFGRVGARAGGQNEEDEENRRLIEHPYVEGGDGSNGYEDASSTAREIRDAENALVKIRGFFETYPAQAGASSEESGKTNKQVSDELAKEFAEVNKTYQSETNPERIDYLKGKISRISGALLTITGKISKFDSDQRDLRGAEKRSLGIRAIWWEVEWMGINDIVAIFKSIGEDIKRQHQRRQQGRIGRVGGALTSWIDKTPILNELPYISTVPAEFQRRAKQAEVDEVENWKKALVDLDSYELQEMARKPANKDQLKAILNILAERGRIDWADTELWDALNRFSYYTMPKEECERNESLREDWLRKVIGDVYDDKDHYRAWKTQNDSSIESEKKKFTTEADRLSNLSGGLTGELSKQLRMFEETKARGEKTMPDDVHPHIYEEILDYSIRNGKMSMEDKFYYLVRGIASGLMNRDRLGYLAGEGAGGLLNIFPFIDYFYGKNNTMPEIQALAKRLTEESDPAKDGHYRPGIKTRLWLELEVSREPRVQERLRKGIDRKAGEMDHDDMHFFIPRLDFQTISGMALPQGGGKQKMSNDGWRNAYSGYNSFFKSLGILSKMEEDRVDGAKFSAEDAYQIIKGVAGYVRMDSILTKRSSFSDTKGRRPSISFGEMRNTYSVASGGEHTVYEDRGKVDIFIRKMLKAYDFEDDYIEKLLLDTESNPNREKSEQDMAEQLSDGLEHHLEKAVKEKGIERMKNLLKESIGNFTESDEEGYNYNNAKEMYKESIKAKREFTKS
ncbi:hypothetical protein HOF56_02400 [Candidatus Peribacteria bacterium]|jgi:hypothetical protein|nr:hypothetical protein [Candidatus Peribacteria bacterium]MBT4021039.1 hypothetical protein [Candidatus Peribacteria bacterium]MBT4240760.1 hypothetical protein [Candidatus Peribacteria bacterium]MBT4474211.1 hypothetical protein [Candidatus Peribacteria bacterium]